jgi:segregation and condensation protein B
MVPPKLSVRPSDTPPHEDARAAAEGAVDPSEVMAHEGWRGLPSNVAHLPSADRREQLRILEALLFAASEPLAEAYLATHLKSEDDVAALLEELKGFYASRGVNLVRVAGKWAFRTAEDLSYLLERHATEQRRLSKAAMETLAIIAYHQPVTRAEIEEIRGVAVSPGTLDALMEVGWVRLRGRRRAPGARSPMARRTSSSTISGSMPSRICPAWPSSRAPGCSTAICRRASRCRSLMTRPP